MISTKVTRKFVVEKLPKGNGGVRMREIVPPGEEAVIGTIYVNQSYTKTLGRPVDLTVTIEPAS